MKKKSSRRGETLKSFFLNLFQRLWVTFEFFSRNKLSNHAAASAYGFLLSSAPALLIISFFVSRALLASPETAADMFQSIGFLSTVFNAKDFINNFLSSANPGFAGIVSGITILWTARLCALSVQRGLDVIYDSRFNPLRNAAVTFLLGFLIILFIFVFLLGSRIAVGFYNSPFFALFKTSFLPVSVLGVYGLSHICLFVMTLVSYRFAPRSRRQWKHILIGTFVCMAFYWFFSMAFSLLMNPARYNFLYGTLGRLLLLLINVYFFFVFFFFGAQLIQVLGSSDALLFIRFRQIHSRLNPPRSPWNKLFTSPLGPLKKYVRSYKEGDFIFLKGSHGKEVYYILAGNAGVYLDGQNRNRIAVLAKGNFFGEMEYLGSEGRAASIKAETNLSVIVLPPDLFRIILGMDTDTDQNLIKALSERLKSTNERVVPP